MAPEFDPYSILGVPLDASTEDVKAAYRRAARRLHPDVNQKNPGAVVQFQDITVAYELLMDADRRRSHDKEAARARQGNGSLMNFVLRVTPSKRAVMPLPESQVVYLLAEVLPDARAREQHQTRESRLNLTLVLDHSNSMNGIRLEKVKVAAHQIIDQLTPNDILSVITFNDWSEVIIPAAPVSDKPALKARINMMTASGGTEIFKGLSAGVEQSRRFLGPKLVNQIILLTDGHTFGDHERCIELAQQAAKEGMVISAMGLGHEWNDEFLDQLASTSGGTTTYISSAGAVVPFLNDHVRQLARAFAERLRISIAPDPDVQLESAFKLAPHPQPLMTDDGYIQLGSLQVHRPVSILFQCQLPANMEPGFRSVARIVTVGDILENHLQNYQAISDISLEVHEDPPSEDPPPSILDALGKLTLYRMQERAQEALERGDVREATRRLENLATRLLDFGEEDLAQQVMAEARRVAYTSALSDKGRKTLKYETRYLLLSPTVEDQNV